MVARIEATTLGLDIRYIVTSLAGSAKYHGSFGKSADTRMID
jgi:hypothetical protein